MCRKLVVLVLVLAFAGAASAGLVARYTFNDGTATNVGGSAGAAANGSLEGGAVIVNDVGGNGAFPWDPDKGNSPVLSLMSNQDPWGANVGYVNAGGGGGGWGDLAGDKVVTLMAWYKVAIDPARDYNFAAIVSKGNGESGSGAWTMGAYGRSPDVAFNSYSTGGWQGLPSTNPDSWDGEWHHVAGQFHPEGDFGAGYEQATSNIYVDGLLWNTAMRWGPGTLSAHDVYIGAMASATGGAASRLWYGYVDDVRIYDEFLTGAAIYDCYQEGFIDDPDIAIPEPATIALLGLGGLALIRRKR